MSVVLQLGHGPRLAGANYVRKVPISNNRIDDSTSALAENIKSILDKNGQPSGFSRGAVEVEPYDYFTKRGPNGQPLKILGEKSSRTDLKAAMLTDLLDQNTVRGLNLILARDKQKMAEFFRLLKLIIVLVLFASYSLAVKDCQSTNTCECGSQLNLWYKIWAILNVVLFLFVFSTECFLKGKNPSRKKAKHYMIFVLSAFNPVMIILQAYGIYFIMKINDDELQEKYCLEADSFINTRYISVVTFLVCILKIIHLCIELNKACYLMSVRCSNLHNKRWKKRNFKEALSSCDEEEQDYIRAWKERSDQHKRNQIKESQLDDEYLQNLKQRQQSFLSKKPQVDDNQLKNMKNTKNNIKQNSRRNSSLQKVNQISLKTVLFAYFSKKGHLKTFEEHINPNDDDQYQNYMQQCPICEESFDLNDLIVIMPCDNMHYFHQKCLFQKMYEKPECPICGEDFKDQILNDAANEIWGPSIIQASDLLQKSQE